MSCLPLPLTSLIPLQWHSDKQLSKGRRDVWNVGEDVNYNPQDNLYLDNFYLEIFKMLTKVLGPIFLTEE